MEGVWGSSPHSSTESRSRDGWIEVDGIPSDHLIGRDFVFPGSARPLDGRFRLVKVEHQGTVVGHFGFGDDLESPDGGGLGYQQITRMP